MARRLGTIIVTATALLMVAPAAFACGGLIGANGAVNLLRTTTLAGYTDGIEHYVTSFSFAGAGSGAFGSIVPLPDVPSSVVRGGDWTLQRLQREVAPPSRSLEAFALADTAGRAEVLLETKIDSLNITVLRGGGNDVVTWAKENGFDLSPDAPEVLSFYANRSPIFMAARFDVEDALKRGFQAGDGTPIHVTIPTDNPWVPLRILALGKNPRESVQADVFLLTDRAPALLPAPAGGTGALVAPGMRLNRSEAASASLLKDLRDDKGGSWVGADMWLSHLRLDIPAGDLGFDLAVDSSGLGAPSVRDAGIGAGIEQVAQQAARETDPLLIALAIALIATMLIKRRRALA